MADKKNIFVVIGSAGENSANQRLMEHFAATTQADFHVTVFNNLKTLPHFDPALTEHHPPAPVAAFRQAVAAADGVVICTPEYIFSIPSGLKNALEWCVATTVFSGKPVGLVTAAAHGQKGHEELQLIMQTIMAKFTPETTLLIQAVKGKVSPAGEIKDSGTKEKLAAFAAAFKALVTEEGAQA
jgi:NAD(P)H-dependent FMN reductase